MQLISFFLFLFFEDECKGRGKKFYGFWNEKLRSIIKQLLFSFQGTKREKINKQKFDSGPRPLSGGRNSKESRGEPKACKQAFKLW